MEFKGLKFTETSSAFPEQYEVTDGRGRKVAYVRLRWGHFYVTCPGVEGDLVYEKIYEDQRLGCFPDEEERETQLKAAAKAIKVWKKARKRGR